LEFIYSIGISFFGASKSNAKAWHFVLLKWNTTGQTIEPLSKMAAAETHVPKQPDVVSTWIYACVRHSQPGTPAAARAILNTEVWTLQTGQMNHPASQRLSAALLFVSCLWVHLCLFVAPTGDAGQREKRTAATRVNAPHYRHQAL